MAVKRRVAFMLELNWPLNRHIAVFEGTQRYAAERGNWECVVDEFADRTLPASRRGQVPYDGIIARATTLLARRAETWRIAVVNVWANSPARNLPSVLPDVKAAGRLCAEHLLSRGFRRFASVSRRDSAEITQAQAFAEVVNRAGFPCDSISLRSLHLDTPRGWRGMQQQITTWMNGWSVPIAVLAGAEELGRFVAQQCAARGLRIPLDVAIIAGTNDLVFCEHPPPKLTSVDMGYERLGYEAARLLDGLMKRPAPRGQVKPMLLPPIGIVSRESSDFFAVEDEDVAAALRFIGENCHMLIDVNEVADAIHVSRPTLERRFRRHLGRPIATEIRRLRVERAKRQLIDSSEPLKVIAREVGFANVATMNAVFRRELGMSPGEYRRRTTL
ncbi:MAG: substrate-binding domain-containing protein [Phycisphaeraceae bacterium]